MGILAEIERVLGRWEEAESSARLDPERCPGKAGQVAERLNAVLDSLQETRGWGAVLPQELALANGRYEELLKVLSALRRLSDVLCTARTPEEVCSFAAEVLAEELGFECCSVLLYDREHDELREVAAAGQAKSERATCSARAGVLGRAFRERRPTLLSPKDRIQGLVALVPLRAGEERLGLIRLARPVKGVPTRHLEHGLVLLSAIAAQMLKIVELRRRLDELNGSLGREVARLADQSERRSREMRQLGPVLHDLVELSAQPAVVFSRSGRIIALNQAAAKLLGEPADELMGRRFASLLPPSRRRRAVGDVTAKVSPGASAEKSVRLQTASGRTVSVEVSLRRIGTADGPWLAIAGPDPATAGQIPPSSCQAPPGPKRLLIIDDEVQLLESLRELLAALHHDVTVAASAQEGVEKARWNHFDLVLTDLGMPGMNGWEVAERIKALTPLTTIGLMTGWGAEEPPEELKDSRAVDFVLHKPFDLQEILDRL
jgi:PAS domain S-box-containing protein